MRYQISLEFLADVPGLTYFIIAPLILPFSVATFTLLAFVFRYNLLYVSAFPSNAGGQLYPTALKQLFTGVYVMEICLAGLFLSIRDEKGALTGIGQAVVMILATILTFVFHMLLYRNFSPILNYLPLNPSKVVDSGLIAPISRPTYLRDLVAGYYSWIRPSSQIQRDLRESIEALARREANTRSPSGYRNKAADPRSPIVWIPKDDLGVSEYEIADAKKQVPDLKISN